MIAGKGGREADVSFCEDLDVALRCVQLAGMAAAGWRLVADVHSDLAAFCWMLFGKIPGLQSRRIKYGL